MKRALLVALLAGCFALPLQAGSKAFSAFVPVVNDTAVSDTGRWEIWQDNMGRFVTGPGGFWPRPMRYGYLYGAGLWVGVIDPMRTQGDTAVSWSYNPNSGQSEFCPTTPDGNHNRYLDSLARMFNSRDPRDTAQWPERDSLGRAVISSDQELWAICNDLSPIFMVQPDSAIGVQVIRRTYAWSRPPDWWDIVKVEFDVKNVTGRWGNNPHTLPKVMLGASIDADIGNESGSSANDKFYFQCVSSSPSPNLAVQYQTAQEMGWSIPPPYFVGFKVFVETPNATDTVRVKDDQYFHTILPGQPLGMTALKVYTIQTDPSTPGDRYMHLAGLFSLTDTNDAYGYLGSPGPADLRFLASCGPFSLPNDSTVRLSLHIIGGSDSMDIRRKAEMLCVESPPGPVSQKPSSLALYPCVPNPSSGSCLIRYGLPEPTSVTLSIYDVCGRLVRKLDGGKKPAGSHEARWSGRDGLGRMVPSGVYFCRLEAEGLSKARCVVLLH